MYTKILKVFKGARSYIFKDRTARPKDVCFPLFFIAEKMGGSFSENLCTRGNNMNNHVEVMIYCVKDNVPYIIPKLLILCL